MCARLGRTLEQICNPDGCKLYYTKKGITPVEFKGLRDAVFVCRARQKAGLDLKDYPLPFWAEKAYILGNAVFSQVENEINDDDEDSDGNKPDHRIKGKGDSGAFALIFEHLEEQRLTIKAKEEDFDG